MSLAARAGEFRAQPRQPEAEGARCTARAPKLEAQVVYRTTKLKRAAILVEECG